MSHLFSRDGGIIEQRISPIVHHMLAFHLWRPLFYALKAAKTDHFFGNFRVSGISSSQQGAPTTWLQPDLLESFPADVIPDITGQFGCRHRAKFSPSVEKGGETGL